MISYPAPYRATTAAMTWLGMAPQLRHRKTPLILLVEDDRMIAEMYRHQLAYEGFDIEIATDGKLGLEAIRARKPDLVLLDLRLPLIEGLEVLEQLRTAPAEIRRIPILILSNYGEPRMIRESMDLGARDYLIKSATTPSMLAAKIRSFLPPAPPTRL